MWKFKRFWYLACVETAEMKLAFLRLRVEHQRAILWELDRNIKCTTSSASQDKTLWVALRGDVKRLFRMWRHKE
jgi:predicted 2-oxoglutarate/Fe(II)-dependent dioxygenase YbiX